MRTEWPNASFEQTQEQNKKEWASSVGLCQRHKTRNIPTTCRWARGDYKGKVYRKLRKSLNKRCKQEQKQKTLLFCVIFI